VNSVRSTASSKTRKDKTTRDEGRRGKEKKTKKRKGDSERLKSALHHGRSAALDLACLQHLSSDDRSAHLAVVALARRPLQGPGLQPTPRLPAIRRCARIPFRSTTTTWRMLRTLAYLALVARPVPFALGRHQSSSAVGPWMHPASDRLPRDPIARAPLCAPDEPVLFTASTPRGRDCGACPRQALWPQSLPAQTSSSVLRGLSEGAPLHSQ